MPTTEVRPYAVIMPTDGQFVLTDWTPASTPAETVDREIEHRLTFARPVVVNPAVTMWADADAVWREQPVNAPAGRLLRLLQAPEFSYCGPVLFTGALNSITDSTAEGLTEREALLLIERYLTRNLHIPTQRTR
ncbi:hypothetical protein [Streptomyces sp. NPDC002587]